MPFKLVAADGNASYELRDGAMQVIGRAVQCDISIVDPTISRKHAELVADGTGLAIKDLGSSNGSFINGAKITEQRAKAGDTVTFGKLSFTLIAMHPPPVATPPPPSVDGLSPRPGATIVRQLPVRAKTGELAAVMERGASPSGEQRMPASEKLQQKLAMLLEVSKGLTKVQTLDALLGKIAQYAFQVLEVDRTAILLVDDRGQLVPKISRDKRGGDAPRAVPQSIARTAMDEKVAILSDDAGEDVRFGGQSILMQQVRSAMCAPLLGAEERVLGVLYVDSSSLTKRFNETDDLEFLIAFAGIAAVAIENSQFSERIRREAVVRSNFERFFTPHLAARIANAPDAVKLGGDKRIITVLFSDIRGFTSLSETMNPDDMARVLTEYFTEMVDCVFQHGGTLDKFIGDSVMAQWGAPLGEPDDPDRALQAAIAMMKALDMLNEHWRVDRRPELQQGIGINTGEAFAGNIGSERRLEYTVIGDTVNTASRLCSVANGGEILVSESLKKALHDTVKMERSEPLKLKGKSQPVEVFRVKW